MRSRRGFVAAAVFLLALPVAALCQLLFGSGAEPAMHFMLALGSGLLTAALADFRAARLAIWLGRLSLGALAAVFFIQGVAQTINNARLSQIAFQTLGQRLEGWLVAGFLLWCVAFLIADSRGKTMLLGMVAVALTVAVRAYDFVLAQRGASMDAAMPGLKLLYLTPFVWLLLESRKRR